MKLRIAITDNDWFDFLRGRPDLDEANFWQPSGAHEFHALSPGEPLLFLLHAPRRYIAGGGFFTGADRYPYRQAWDAFREKNGAPTIHEMRRRIEKYRRIPSSPFENYVIGCIILQGLFFFDDSERITVPEDFATSVQQGKNYDTTEGIGKRIWAEVQDRLQGRRLLIGEGEPAEIAGPMFGKPVPVRRRLGQGGFQLLVTKAYQRRCAVTGEKILPVLEAAHIKPVAESGPHRIDNGLLLRRDIHALFDEHYLMIDPDTRRLQVSHRLKDEFDNGEYYRQFDGSRIWLPPRPEDQPSAEFLEYQAEGFRR